MRGSKLDAIFPVLAVAIIVYALSQQFFGVPPIGKLLDPFIGIIQNEDVSREEDSHKIDLIGLKEEVRVYFDARKVPHIYANNTYDLYFAQGYVTASLRLWQMDFISYLAAGRMAELFGGEHFFEYDRNQRRIGILEAAKRSLQEIENDPQTREVISAYSEGVNAYINQLGYRDLPLEYKVLNYEPERWTSLKTVLVLKNLANTLSGYENDILMTRLMLVLGEIEFNKYFPQFTKHISPVAPGSISQVNPTLAYVQKPDYLDYSFLSSKTVYEESSYNPRLGSNSWVVSGEKTKSGYPILCNDPHLSLSLPAIWLEMQLTAPGVNTYGVTIPGAPTVIIGFNEDIAWGISNGCDDVKDWYKLRLSEDLKNYELDGKWKPLRHVVEEIKRKDQKTFFDTVFYSEHGPLVNTGVFPGRETALINHALRWELHNPSNEFLTFIKLAGAKNYPDYREAIKYFSCPVLNFTFACKDNTIAVHHEGNMPVKWPGQGKFILDGTKSGHLYSKYIPRDSLSYTVNPACHYVIAANQHPSDNTYAYYYNGNYSENRANRINSLLSHADGLDIEAMKRIQMDNTNYFTAYTLPLLIKIVDDRRVKGNEKSYLNLLRHWTGAYDLDSRAAKLYELWWHFTREFTWDEFKEYSFEVMAPNDEILIDLIEKEPDLIYFDSQQTPERETAADIVGNAFHAAVEEYHKLEEGQVEKWGDQNRVDIDHMLNVEEFSRRNLGSAGCPDAINAMSLNWGPSWRMIVELGERPHAVGVYAGGQSGNAASTDYGNFIDPWIAGEYFPLLFFMSEKEAIVQKEKIVWTLK